MSSQLFPTALSARLACVPVHQLYEWLERCIMTPAQKGTKGRGKAHRFSLMQVVGIAVANKVRRSNRGCNPDYCALIISAFEHTDEDTLKEYFKKGKTHLHLAVKTPLGPILIIGDKMYDSDVNVYEIYLSITNKSCK